MSTTTFTLTDLRRILLEGAGADDGADLTAGGLGNSFADLGYDSLALLETGSRIEREFGISLDDAALAEADTPAALIDVVNAQLATLSETPA